MVEFTSSQSLIIVIFVMYLHSRTCSTSLVVLDVAPLNKVPLLLSLYGQHCFTHVQSESDVRMCRTLIKMIFFTFQLHREHRKMCTLNSWIITVSK